MCLQIVPYLLPSCAIRTFLVSARLQYEIYNLIGVEGSFSGAFFQICLTASIFSASSDVPLCIFSDFTQPLKSVKNSCFLELFPVKMYGNGC